MKNFLIILLAIIAIPAIAQQKLSPEKITIYKSGTYHVVKEGVLKFAKKTAYLDANTQPLIGTYWLSGGKGMQIQFKIDTIKVNKNVNDFNGLLSANKGKDVKVTYTIPSVQDKVLEASGAIVDFSPNSGLLKLQTGSNPGIFLNTRLLQIVSIQFSGTEKNTYQADSTFRVSKITIDKDLESLNVQLHYMGTGFMWHPSYYLKLLNDKDARLEMKALIENSTEDLNNVETQLVVGSPNMYYGSTLDPIAANYSMPNNTGYLSSAKYSLNNSYSNQIAEQSAVDDYSSTPSYFTNTFGAEGEKNYDLYQYKLGKITIPKNSKLYYPIFAENVTFEEKYESVVSDYVSFYTSRYVQQDEKKYDVWHTIEMKNTTSYPLTTAPVFVENEKNDFLSQDLLEYTPINSVNSIKLSKAIDIVLKNKETETTRESAVKKIDNVTYNRVYIKGTITIQNFQKKAVTVVIKKQLTGEVTTAVDGKISKQPNPIYMNSASTISWEVKLAADEKKELEYNYSVFFKAN